jgi:tRNA pseudouridine38-40 synthase
LDLKNGKVERYFIKLAYNGTHYHGWQIQENAHTVQAEINEKLSLILGEEINLVGCGRTDTGVHAREFYAHFESKMEISKPGDIAFKLDRFLPDDIVIHKIFKVAPDLHSRFSAIERTYKYYINQVKDPFSKNQSYFYHGPIEIQAMKDSCQYLSQFTDFTSFSKLHTQTSTNRCAIKKAEWEVDGDKLIFTITADRFLRNMVRAIVGTMMEIGKGKIPAKEMKSIIEAKDRSKAGYSVPAGGLFLEKVRYNFNPS